MICYFSTKTGNTERFVNTLPHQSIRIRSGLVVDKPFVLATATYANGDGKGAVARPVVDFIRQNHHNLIAVISSGNRSFGSMFAIAGDIIAKNCNIPLIYKYELFGTEYDTIQVTKKLEQLTYDGRLF